MFEKEKLLRDMVATTKDNASKIRSSAASATKSEKSKQEWFSGKQEEGYFAKYIYKW